MSITPKRLAEKVGKYALSKKAFDIKILDLRKISAVCDFFVICSANVELHAQAIADAVLDNLEKEGMEAWHNEGYTTSKWILLDYVDVVVHIFLKDTRDYYSLERLWGDAPVMEISEEEQGSSPGKDKL